MMPHSFSVRLEPEDGCWIRAPAAVMVVHESNFHAPCCEACGKEWGKTVPTAESDPFVMVLSKLHVHPAESGLYFSRFGPETRLAAPIDAAPSVHGLPLMAGSIDLGELYRTI